MRTSIISAALLVALAGCASEKAPSGDSLGSSECSSDADAVTVTGDLDAKPTVTVPESAPPCELITTDLTVGDGDEAIAGSTLQMHYVGVSWSTGTQFDASWDRGQPFEFTLDAGMVIPGWDQGIQGMKVGGRRLLVIPPDLGYGETGQGEIAGGETLVFVVDLSRIVGPVEPLVCGTGELVADRSEKEAGSIVVEVTGEADQKPKVKIPDTDPPKALECIDIREGDGPEAAKGDQLSMQYVGISWSTKEQFDTSWGRAPFDFGLGGGQVIGGWDQGILGMKAGGRRLLVIPPDLGYGAAGAGGVIGPNETLVFVVDLLSIS